MPFNFSEIGIIKRKDGETALPLLSDRVKKYEKESVKKLPGNINTKTTSDKLITLLSKASKLL